MANTPSLKHIQIDKANSTTVLVVAVAAFISIFALMSSKTLYSELLYQDKVISAKQQSLTQLQTDVTANKQLATSYQSFVNTKQNLIGGNPTGSGQKDGDNGKIVLDALPSQYDFPALTTSVQFLLNQAGANIDSIGGTDEQANVATNGSISATASSSASATSTTAVPGTAVAMPFEFSVDAPYSSIQNVFSDFEKSIRPMPFQTVTISGDQSDLTLSVSAQSYYQPEKDFAITTEAVQ